jgi:uncharacterized protein YjiS (DUF1127 family)
MARIGTTDTPETVQRHRPWATISAFMGPLVLWRWRVRSRSDLSTLSARQMRDVGLDPDVVRRESEKPFWQA